MPNWLVVMRHNLNNDELGGTTGVWEGDAVSEEVGGAGVR